MMASKRKINRLNDVDSNKKTKTEHEEIQGNGKDFFSGLTFYILKAGIEKARREIFERQICQNKGELRKDFKPDSNTSHIIVDDKMEVTRMLKLLGLNYFPSAVVVKTQWVSLCLKAKKLVESDSFELKPEFNSSSKHQEEVEDLLKHQEVIGCSNNDASESNMPDTDLPVSSGFGMMKREVCSQAGPPKVENDILSDSDYEPSDDEAKEVETDFEKDSVKKIPVEKWICAQSSKNLKPNYNKHITDKLEEMVKAYDSTNDKWRSYGYQKCIRALIRHPKAISSWEEAKSLPGVGGRLADKIWEIAQSGELRKLNEFKTSEEIRTLELFNNVWGAGPKSSQIWYHQGYRSIDDLRNKAKLTSQQKVGVRLYDELLDRMSREEAGRIGDVVREAAESIQPGIIAQVCGSYRRGQATCGDVDVLVTHPDGKSHIGVFGKLLDKLHKSGFLTDDLVSAEDNGNQTKYLGVCKLPGEASKHRRLDIIVVPYNEYACALLYFTGSAHFNRSLRLLCKRQDMSLSEHALRYGVIRHGGERVHEGMIIPTPTEESLFNIMKIPYRPPEERDH